MDIILWRSAEAEDESADLERRLTTKGRRQAEHAAQWLHHRLPSRFALLASPATRAKQTASMLEVPAKTEKALAPGASTSEILKALGWPSYKGVVVAVGHQPELGEVLGMLLSEGKGRWSVKKGGLWWLTNRVRNEEAQVIVRAVMSPELL